MPSRAVASIATVTMPLLVATSSRRLRASFSSWVKGQIDSRLGQAEWGRGGGRDVDIDHDAHNNGTGENNHRYM